MGLNLCRYVVDVEDHELVEGSETVNEIEQLEIFYKSNYCHSPI